MLYGVKLNREELFMAKKKGLVFLHFIGQKIWKKFEMEICLLRREGQGGYISKQILLKQFKSQLLMVPKLLIVISYW